MTHADIGLHIQGLRQGSPRFTVVNTGYRVSGRGTQVSEAEPHRCMPTLQNAVASRNPKRLVKVKRTALYCGYLPDRRGEHVMLTSYHVSCVNIQISKDALSWREDGGKMHLPSSIMMTLR